MAEMTDLDRAQVCEDQKAAERSALTTGTTTTSPRRRSQLLMDCYDFDRWTVALGSHARSKPLHHLRSLLPARRHRNNERWR